MKKTNHVSPLTIMVHYTFDFGSKGSVRQLGDWVLSVSYLYLVNSVINNLVFTQGYFRVQSLDIHAFSLDSCLEIDQQYSYLHLVNVNPTSSWIDQLLISPHNINA